MTFHLYGIIPIPAWLAVSGIFAYDTYSTMAKSVSQYAMYFSKLLTLPAHLAGRN